MMKEIKERIVATFAGGWLAVGMGILLLMSAVLRFSWDTGPQAALHMGAVLLMAAFAARYAITYRAAYHSLFVLFFVSALLSGLSATDRMSARNALMVLADGLLAGYLMAFIPGEWKRKVLMVPVFVGMLLSVMLLASFLSHPLLSLTGRALPSTLFVNPSVAAGYLVLCLPLSFILWKDGRYEGVVISAALFAGIVLTRSRTAVLVSLFAASFILWRRQSFSQRKVAMALSVAGLGMLLLITLFKVERIESLLHRISWYQTAVQMFLSNPSGGVGWGNYGSLYLSFRTGPGLNTLYAHNLVLQLLAEAGLPGLLSFIVLLLVFVRNAVVAAAEGQRDLAEILVVAVLAFFLANMFDYSFYAPGVMLLFFVCVGAVVNLVPRERAGRALSGTIAVLIVLVAAHVIARPLRAERQMRQGIDLMENNDLGPAEGHLLKAQHLDPLNPAPPRALACLYYKRYSDGGRPADLVAAIESQSRSLQRYPDDARSWSDLAWLYRTAGKRDKAIAAMLQAAQYDRYNKNYPHFLAEITSSSKRPSK